jgi:hypothetical protein
MMGLVMVVPPVFFDPDLRSVIEPSASSVGPDEHPLYEPLGAVAGARVQRAPGTQVGDLGERVHVRGLWFGRHARSIVTEVARHCKQARVCTWPTCRGLRSRQARRDVENSRPAPLTR